MLLINWKYISTYRFPWLLWYLMWHCCVLRSICLEIKAHGAVSVSSMWAFMLTQYIDSCTSSLVFFMAMWFMCSWFSALFYNDTGTISLPFIVISSVIAISSMNDQNGWSSLCPSAFIDGQPQTKYFHIRPKCSSFRIATQISLVLMQCGISVHDPIPFMVMLIPGISLPLSHDCAWIANLLWRVVVLVVQYSYVVLMHA